MTAEQKVEQKPSWAREKLVRFNLWTRDRGINVGTIGSFLGFLYPPAWGLAIAGWASATFDQLTVGVLDRDGAIERKRAQEMGLTTSLIDKFRGSWRFFNTSPKTVRAAA